MDMLWYVIQTYSGREEKLVEMIRRIVPTEYYGECFVVYYEQLRDRKQKNQIHILRMFPGYIFISSDDVEKIFQYLKMVPTMSKIMTAGAFVFTPLYEGEAEFLMRIMDDDHIVRLTYVATDGKNHVSLLSGPLEKCRTLVKEYRFRDRYAMVGLRIVGQEKIVRMGIILNDDIRREMAYGKAEVKINMLEKYAVSASGKSSVLLKKGDKVIVIEGGFEGNVAVVNQVKNGEAQISVHMFGRNIFMNVPMESIKKLA